MIITLATPMILAATCDRMRTASETGQEIYQALSNVTAHFHSSVTFGDKWHQSVNALMDVVNDCSRSGWDGYHAIPVSQETVVSALAFIRTIPLDLPLPELSATPGGEITFEWAQTSRRIVTVAVAGTGELHYAGLNGTKKSFGSYPLNGVFEPELRQLISSVLG
jgi:hypothetical protein